VACFEQAPLDLALSRPSCAVRFALRPPRCAVLLADLRLGAVSRSVARFRFPTRPGQRPSADAPRQCHGVENGRWSRCSTFAKIELISFCVVLIPRLSAMVMSSNETV
jgi:hypothetical protein